MPGSKTRILPEPAPVRLLIGHWKSVPHARSSTRHPLGRLRLRPLQGFLAGLATLFAMCSFFVMAEDDQTQTLLMPGQRLARGVCRHLLGHGFVSVEELVPSPGLRVDVMALGPKGEIWVIECKSGRADFAADRKWQNYLEWCDRFFWAVDLNFPTEILPEDTGLILADDYGAEILRMGPATLLAPARRKVMVQKFARHAALRLQALRDPRISASP